MEHKPHTAKKVQWVLIETGNLNDEDFANVMGVFDTEEEAKAEAISLLEDMAESMDYYSIDKCFNPLENWEMEGCNWSYAVKIQER